MEAFRLAEELEPGRLRYRYEASRTALLAGDVSYGLRLAEELYGEFPDNLMVMELIAYARLVAGRTDDALPLYLRIMELQPAYEPAVWNVSLVYEREERYEEAYGVLRGFFGAPGGEGPEAVKGAESGGGALRERFLRLADLAEKSGEAADAAGWLAAALSAGGGEGQTDVPEGGILRRLAELLEETGEPEAAVVRYRELMEDDGPGAADPELLFSLARLLISGLEDYSEGLEVLRRSLEAGFSDTAALDALRNNPDLLDPAAVEAVIEEFAQYGAVKKEGGP
jgi:tetratricopeptide (TPR) repeat protein